MSYGSYFKSLIALGVKALLVQSGPDVDPMRARWSKSLAQCQWLQLWETLLPLPWPDACPFYNLYTQQMLSAIGSTAPPRAQEPSFTL